MTGTGGLRGGVMEAHGDHRLAMLGAVAGLASREGVEVVGMEAAAVSYPGFTPTSSACSPDPPPGYGRRDGGTRRPHPRAAALPRRGRATAGH